MSRASQRGSNSPTHEHCAEAQPGADTLSRELNLDELAVAPSSTGSKEHPASYINDDLSKAESQLFDGDVGVSNLDELNAPVPDQNSEEDTLRYYRSLEEETNVEQGHQATEGVQQTAKNPSSVQKRELLQLYTISWLSLFSILGTLARLGVEWLTYYPNAPVTSNVLWANFGGSLFMGFLQEDQALFAEQRQYAALKPKGSSSGTDVEHERKAHAAEHLAAKKLMPLYIGLTVGFCGSFTSFSSFMLDLFLGLSDDLVGKSANIPTRNPGWSVCSVLAVAIIHVTVSLSALVVGAHIAIALLPLLCRIPQMNSERYTNSLAVFLGIGCWLGAVLLAIWPPHDRWRSVVFALVFAPLGCILRYVLAKKLNGVFASFPLGTFMANLFGTAVLGLAYDIQHVPLASAGKSIGGGILGCQVLTGIIQGFCGCLTTVSTWVVEMRNLKKHHAYIYGSVSISVGFSLMVVIIGSLHWTVGISRPVCTV
ncbi:CrcB-like protein-domain-containing protein [Dendryphion nanum]|uniref:CrcB-like protein-domain-containing protein n=1 Tax=Dendryphion nanum TaxID=256645 RepID=A0A9P9CZ05_9PLEO|nr:CrcB-like protein-domain-containing protein [Dendryphion nanum]